MFFFALLSLAIQIRAGINDPLLTGTFSGFNFTNANSLAVSDGYAYLSISKGMPSLPGELVIVDVRDPKHPQRVGGTNTTADIADIAVSGHYAYLVGDLLGMAVFDVADPANPIPLGALNVGGGTYSISVAGHYAYLTQSITGASPTGKLWVVDITDPNKLTVASSVGTLGLPQHTTISSNYAYMASISSGNFGYQLQVINIADPLHATYYTAFTGQRSAGAADAAGLGQYAYFINDAGLVKIIDISNQGTPAVVGDFPGGSRIQIADQRAYVAKQGVEITDISNPLAPQRIGGYAANGSTPRMAISGNQLYLLDRTTGLLILDIFHPVVDPPGPVTLSYSWTNGTLRLSVPPGIGGSIQRATQLGNWQPWKNVPSDMGTLIDTNNPSVGAQFYRFAWP